MILLSIRCGLIIYLICFYFFFSSRRRHTRCALVTGVQTCALPIFVSPTDPIAVSAIAKRVPIPKRMMHILEGESLLNDASGLVCLRFAIAAALTGAFSIQDAAFNFLWVAFGGIAVGTGVTWGIARTKTWLSRHYGEEGGAQILISLV